MIIEEKDFRLTPVSEESLKYDVELLYVIQPKGKESRLEFKNVAYGVSLEYALKLVAQYRVNCNHKNEAISLMTYFTEYKNELNSLTNLCKI